MCLYCSNISIIKIYNTQVSGKLSKSSMSGYPTALCIYNASNNKHLEWKYQLLCSYIQRLTYSLLFWAGNINEIK